VAAANAFKLASNWPKHINYRSEILLLESGEGT
jgi:hypothetical protein